MPRRTLRRRGRRYRADRPRNRESPRRALPFFFCRRFQTPERRAAAASPSRRVGATKARPERERAVDVPSPACRRLRRAATRADLRHSRGDRRADRRDGRRLRHFRLRRGGDPGRGAARLRLPARASDAGDLAGSACRTAGAGQSRSRRLGRRGAVSPARRGAVDARDLRVPARLVDACRAEFGVACRVRPAGGAPLRRGSLPRLLCADGDRRRADPLAVLPDGFRAADRRLGRGFRADGRGDPLHLRAGRAARLAAGRFAVVRPSSTRRRRRRA